MSEKKLEEMTDAERAVYWEKQYEGLKKDAINDFNNRLLSDIVRKGEDLLRILEEVPIQVLTCLGVSSENVDIFFKSKLAKWVAGIKAYNKRESNNGH